MAVMEKEHILPFLWMRGESEEILREELGKIRECGIKAVCLEARPHDDFCGEGWWHDVDIVIDEAKKYGMQIWILDDKHFPTGYANGGIADHPERKKLYLACSTADVFGRGGKHTLDVSRMLKPSIGYWQIGQPVDYAERANNRLFALVALRFREGDVFTEEDVIDLTDTIHGRYADFTLPEGSWRVHCLYFTRTDGGDDTYINMIDEVSARTQIEGVYEAHWNRYHDLFGSVIAGFFSDEPQFGNVIAFNSWDIQVGRYRMQLPWSDELQGILAEQYGDSMAKVLPFLFAESEEKKVRSAVRFAYMDTCSRLYEKNFSNQIGRWCEDHGVEYIGHVVEDEGLHSRLGMGAAHYFRSTAGQHMAGIDCIGGQIFRGAPNVHRKGMTDTEGEFYHHALGKLGPSMGHLDPKKQGRTMCELFGAYGWSFGVRDMKYLFEHLLAKGVNYLVPHAFSMAEYPDIDCPPHFYARGNNPQFPYFARLMKYADRMCKVFSGGEHLPECAVLYDGEADWNGSNVPMQKICRVLDENQFDYDIVPIDMLTETKDGVMTVNGLSFRALVIGASPALPAKLADWLRANPDFPVIFVGGRPCGRIGKDTVVEDEAAGTVCQAAELAAELRGLGLGVVKISPADTDITVYRYEKDGKVLTALFNENADRTWRGRVSLPEGEDVLVSEAWLDRTSQLTGDLELAPGELAVLAAGSADTVYVPLSDLLAGARKLDLSKGWKISKAGCGKDAVFSEPEEADTLTAISDTEPAFAGTIRYTAKVVLDRAPEKAWFTAKNVYEVMKVTVNGTEAGAALADPYAVEIDGLLREGENTLEVEVVTTPARDQLERPGAPFDFQYDAMDPTGMFGEVSLYLC